MTKSIRLVNSIVWERSGKRALIYVIVHLGLQDMSGQMMQMELPRKI